jgi:hypothetical protein
LLEAYCKWRGLLQLEKSLPGDCYGFH